MKTLVPPLLCAFALIAFSTPAQHYTIIPDYAAQEAARVAQEQRDAIINAAPHDPVRLLNNKRVSANGPGWCRFWGVAESVSPDIIIINGTYSGTEAAWRGTFILENFPYPVANSELFLYEQSWWAHNEGITTNGAVHHLDYKKVWHPAPPTPLEKLQQAEAAAAAKAKSETTINAYWQEKAAQGDAKAQYELGKRYRDGNGLMHDMAKAREWFAKSAAQGNKDAQEALTHLP